MGESRFVQGTSEDDYDEVVAILGRAEARIGRLEDALAAATAEVARWREAATVHAISHSCTPKPAAGPDTAPAEHAEPPKETP